MTPSTSPECIRGDGAAAAAVAPPIETVSAVNLDEGSSPSRRALNLLELPYDIRFEIYGILLVSRQYPESLTWQAGSTSRKTVPLYMSPSPLFRTLEPAILRTCRQIYREAVPVLYGQNLFSINDPLQLTKFMTNMASDSPPLLRSLEICVPWTQDVNPWADMFDSLVQDAPGLRYVEITWSANSHAAKQNDRGWGSGLGTNVDFVKALARLRTVDTLILKGFYAKPWPEYLRRATGADVQALAGYCRKLDGCYSRQWDVNAVTLWNEETRDLFTNFQRGTEDLSPQDEIS
jgi:hypothetical protein